LPIPPNGAEAQSRNVVFNLKINPDPESWATGTNCEMNAEARADSQPRWIQYVPYTASEPWTSWKITDFKITLGGTVVWTGESAMDEGAPRIIKAIRYASNHFPNGKATFKVSAKFVFYRNGVQGEIRELSTTTQVRVHNQVFAWSTWWSSNGICGDPEDPPLSWKVKQSGQNWIPDTPADELSEAQNMSLYRELACNNFVQQLKSVNYDFATSLPGLEPKYLYCRVHPGLGTPDAAAMLNKFDEGMSLATVFLSLGHGTSSQPGPKALITSRNLEAVAAATGPINIKDIVGLRDSSAQLAPRPQFAALYTCFSTEDIQYLDPFRVKLATEFSSPDRALVGFDQDVSILTLLRLPNATAQPIAFKNIDTNANELALRLQQGMPLWRAVEFADKAAPRMYVSSQTKASMSILNDGFYRLHNVYFYPIEYFDPERLLYFDSWYMPL
jgi:hypothetical protein